MSESTPRPSFERIGSQRTYEAVVEQIKQKILNGELTAGSNLPTELQLCDELGVSRSSVREAMRSLEALGIVQVTRGRGPNHGARIRAAPASVLSDLLSLNVALYGWSLRDLVDARVALERQAVAAAASIMAAEPTRAEVEQLLEQMNSSHGPEDYHQIDVAFHVNIAALSHNPVVISLMEGLRGAVAGLMVQAFRAVDDWPETQERLSREHRAIWDAVLDGDPAAAAARMEQHIRGFYEHALVALEERSA
jgi:GntR family transcriptional regulator, transcriptional repressor for pyruvate dehydrogenase complex